MWLIDKISDLKNNISNQFGNNGFFGTISNACYHSARFIAGFVGSTVCRAIVAAFEFVLIPLAVIATLVAAWRAVKFVTGRDVSDIKNTVVEILSDTFGAELNNDFGTDVGVIAGFIFSIVWAKVAVDAIWRKFAGWFTSAAKSMLGEDSSNKNSDTLYDLVGKAGCKAGEDFVDTIADTPAYVVSILYSSAATALSASTTNLSQQALNTNLEPEKASPINPRP